MRIDHIAFRVHDRAATVNFLCDALGYKVQQEFPIYFNEEKTEMAMCTALEPPEKLDAPVPWTTTLPGTHRQEYHMPPEIFVSEGTPGSIVYEWVKQRGPGTSAPRRSHAVSVAYSLPVRLARTRMWAATFW